MADEKSHRGDSSLWRKPREILGLRAIKPTPEVEARALRGFSSLFCDSLVHWRLQLEHWIVLPPLGKRRWNRKVARDIHGSSTLLH